MRKLCESPSLVELRLIANYLEHAGVKTAILNEHQGGNPGVPHWALSVWAELWISNEHQFEHARGLLQRYREEQQRSGGVDWVCAGCKETNPDNFEFCWQCGRPAHGAAI